MGKFRRNDSSFPFHSDDKWTLDVWRQVDYIDDNDEDEHFPSSKSRKENSNNDHIDINEDDTKTHDSKDYYRKIKA